MHEMSIARNLLEICLKMADEKKAKAIKSIQISVGILTNIEPHYLETAFNQIKQDSIARKADLIISVCDLEGVCKQCGQEFRSSDYSIACSQCKSHDIEILRGKDMMIDSMELEILNP